MINKDWFLQHASVPRSVANMTAAYLGWSFLAILALSIFGKQAGGQESLQMSSLTVGSVLVYMGIQVLTMLGPLYVCHLASKRYLLSLEQTAGLMFVVGLLMSLLLKQNDWFVFGPGYVIAWLHASRLMIQSPKKAFLAVLFWVICLVTVVLSLAIVFFGL